MIAAVNGAAVGWGMELALMADIRIASEQAKFGELFVLRGLCTDVCGIGRLASVVGRDRAARLLFTGDVIAADEALRIGLVSEVVAHDDLLPTATELAQKIAERPPLAVAKIKEGMRAALDPDWTELGAWVSTSLAALFQTEDHREGVQVVPREATAPVRRTLIQSREETTMPYQYTPEGEALLTEVKQFMDDHIYPNEAEYHEQYESSVTTAARRSWTSSRRRPASAGCGTCSCRTSRPTRPARSSPTSTTRRSPRSSARSGSPPRRSTARRPTRGTWRSSTCTAPRPSSGTGWRRCSRARSARRSR